MNTTTRLLLALLLLLVGQAVAQDQWTEDGESGGALPEMVVEAA